MSNNHSPLPPPKRTRRKPPPLPVPTEKDTGFNESHGYGPCHGGPSGPGDAPSKQSATVVPVEEDEPKGDTDE
jgi:hypothetical protein